MPAAVAQSRTRQATGTATVAVNVARIERRARSGCCGPAELGMPTVGHSSSIPGPRDPVTAEPDGGVSPPSSGIKPLISFRLWESSGLSRTAIGSPMPGHAQAQPSGRSSTVVAQLDEIPVGITQVAADDGAGRAGPLHRALLDHDAPGRQLGHDVGQLARDDEADVRAAWGGMPGIGLELPARLVQVDLARA